MSWDFSVQAKQIVSDHHKSAKQYKKSFDLVLAGKFRCGTYQKHNYAQDSQMLGTNQAFNLPRIAPYFSA
jgi:hypothetical protein